MKKKLVVISVVYIIFLCSIVVYKVAGKNKAYYNYKKLVAESSDKAKTYSSNAQAVSNSNTQSTASAGEHAAASVKETPGNSTSGSPGQSASLSTNVPSNNAVEAYNNVKFSRHLALGSTGEDVKKLQYILKEKGFYKEGITGSFDKNTSKALIDYQKANNIRPADGILGPGTWNSF